MIGDNNNNSFFLRIKRSAGSKISVAQARISLRERADDLMNGIVQRVSEDIKQYIDHGIDEKLLPEIEMLWRHDINDKIGRFIATVFSGRCCNSMLSYDDFLGHVARLQREIDPARDVQAILHYYQIEVLTRSIQNIDAEIYPKGMISVMMDLRRPVSSFFHLYLDYFSQRSEGDLRLLNKHLDQYEQLFLQQHRLLLSSYYRALNMEYYEEDDDMFNLYVDQMAFIEQQTLNFFTGYYVVIDAWPKSSQSSFNSIWSEYWEIFTFIQEWYLSQNSALFDHSYQELLPQDIMLPNSPSHLLTSCDKENFVFAMCLFALRAADCGYSQSYIDVMQILQQRLPNISVEECNEAYRLAAIDTVATNFEAIMNSGVKLEELGLTEQLVAISKLCRETMEMIMKKPKVDEVVDFCCQQLSLVNEAPICMTNNP